MIKFELLLTSLIFIYLSNIFTIQQNYPSFRGKVKNNHITKLLTIPPITNNSFWLTSDEEIPSISPINKKEKAYISAFYGERMHPILKYKKFHYGIDFSAKIGTAVISTAKGEIIEANKNNSYGKYIIVKHNETYTTIYAHLSEHKVKKGDIFNQGDLIGLVGKTGLCLAPNLNYEVKKDGKNVDPINYFIPINN